MGNTTKKDYKEALVLGGILGLFTVAFVRTAWVADDAYITFRVVDNFLNGLGLVWNAGERVQVYTHPLWLFLLIPLTSLLQDPYWAVLLISYILLIATLLVILRGWSGNAQALGVLILLLASRSFVDYSSSGLENPLSHLLVAASCFSAMFLRERKQVMLSATTFGLAYITRPDLVVLLSPLVLYVFLRGRARLKDEWHWWLLGAAPIVLWTLFSLFYYGSPVPNTALAKVGTGVGWLDLARSAVNYFQWSLQWDPITPALIVAGLAIGWLSNQVVVKVMAGSLTLWLLYLLAVGADYMGGRFFSCVLVVAIFVLMSEFDRRKWRAVPWMMALAVLGSYGLTLFSPASFQSSVISRDGIADERGYYYQYTGMMNNLESDLRNRHPWSVLGALSGQRDQINVAACTIGMYGYAAGAQVRIIDPLALAEPFLARLPSRSRARVGHYERAFPPGYVESRLSGEDVLKDRTLGRLWTLVRHVTTGPLWSMERLSAIWSLNISLSSMVGVAKFDKEKVLLPGAEERASDLLTCMGQRSLSPFWKVDQEGPGGRIRSVAIGDWLGSIQAGAGS